VEDVSAAALGGLAGCGGFAFSINYCVIVVCLFFYGGGVLDQALLLGGFLDQDQLFDGPPGAPVRPSGYRGHLWLFFTLLRLPPLFPAAALLGAFPRPGDGEKGETFIFSRGAGALWAAPLGGAPAPFCGCQGKSFIFWGRAPGGGPSSPGDPAGGPPQAFCGCQGNSFIFGRVLYFLCQCCVHRVVSA